MKTATFINQNGDRPSITIKSGKIQINGSLQHGDILEFATKTDAMIMLTYCDDVLKPIAPILDTGIDWD